MDGHHVPYLSAILKIEGIEFVLALPKPYHSCSVRTYVVPDAFRKRYDVLGYYRYLHEIKRIIRIEKPDMIHFLCGDEYRRYFGLGLISLNKHKAIYTIHKYYKGFVSRIALFSFLASARSVVVHTEYLKQEYYKILRRNIVLVQYPQLHGRQFGQKESRSYYGLSQGKKVIGSLGGTRDTKGLDILLKALSYVKEDYILFIAGKEEDIKKEQINELISAYKDKVQMNLRVLSDAEYSMAVAATDIVVLPYKKEFDGASGPLTEGVWNYKMIIGPNHGNLGNTIVNNHLGRTFQTEDIKSLSEVISSSIKTDFIIDQEYENYRLSLSEDLFIDTYKRIYTSV